MSSDQAMKFWRDYIRLNYNAELRAIRAEAQTMMDWAAETILEGRVPTVARWWQLRFARWDDGELPGRPLHEMFKDEA